ncbi:hypothetical protein D3C87_1952080 [compost metagenome]
MDHVTPCGSWVFSIRAVMSLLISPRERPFTLPLMVTTRVRLSRLMTTGPLACSMVARSLMAIGPLGVVTVKEPSVPRS